MDCAVNDIRELSSKALTSSPKAYHYANLVKRVFDLLQQLNAFLAFSQNTYDDEKP